VKCDSGPKKEKLTVFYFKDGVLIEEEVEEEKEEDQ